MPKKDEGKKMTSQASPSAANTNTDTILAAIASHGVELAKICALVDDLKKSMEGRLDSIEACLSTLQKEHREAEHRLDGMDEALSAADSRITALEATCKDLSTANGLLKAKVNDLEGRSRRHNVRIVGIKEGEESGRPTEFVSRLIPELLGRDNFTKPVKIDRAHRSLRPKPLANERPRVIIARLHNYGDLVSILRLSRQQAPLQYQGERVSIFPDYTAEVSSMRQAFSTVRKKLMDAGAKCSLRFPAKLQVIHNNSVKTFDSPADAERFANTLVDKT